VLLLLLSRVFLFAANRLRRRVHAAKCAQYWLEWDNKWGFWLV
jgi:hypothetical protein